MYLRAYNGTRMTVCSPPPSQVFHGLSKIIQQCWLHRSEARLSALRVKKNIGNLVAMKTEKKERT